MAGALDRVHLLAAVRDRVEEALCVARCAGVVGAVPHHERGDVRVGPVHHAVRVGAVEAPLGEPAAQRREAGQPHRRHVDDARIAQVAAPWSAAVRVDGRIEPARVGHRPVDDEGTLVVGASGSAERRELGLDPRGDAGHARALGLAEAGQEGIRVGRGLAGLGVVEVEGGVAAAGIELVCDGRVDPLAERAGAAHVRRHEKIASAAGSSSLVRSGGAPAGVARTVGASACS